MQDCTSAAGPDRGVGFGGSRGSNSDRLGAWGSQDGPWTIVDRTFPAKGWIQMEGGRDPWTPNVYSTPRVLVVSCSRKTFWRWLLV